MKILDFLKSYTFRNGYPPSIAEIGKEFNIYQNAVKGHLSALEKKGFIKINPKISRGVEITGLSITEGRAVSVIGNIRAGEPIYSFEDISARIYIDKDLFPSENPFSLRIKGDSMKEAGIFEGDYVIVNPQQTVEDGDIAVVLIEDETTIKRVFIEKDRIILRPENSAMKESHYKTSEVAILGKVIGVIRKI